MIMIIIIRLTICDAAKPISALDVLHTYMHMHGRAPGLLFTRKTPAHVQLRVAGRAEEFTILAKVLASADLFRRTLAQFTQAKHVEWYLHLC